MNTRDYIVINSLYIKGKTWLLFVPIMGVLAETRLKNKRFLAITPANWPPKKGKNDQVGLKLVVMICFTAPRPRFRRSQEQAMKDFAETEIMR